MITCPQTGFINSFRTNKFGDVFPIFIAFQCLTVVEVSEEPDLVSRADLTEHVSELVTVIFAR